MRQLKLNTSFKYHFLVGLFTSIWLVVFLVLIAPFDVADLSFTARLIMMPVYGIIAFLSYVVLLPLQNWFFQQYKRWTILSEISFITLFQLIALIGSYAYYKSSILNGDYPFPKFTLEVYYPIFILLLSVIIFARWFLSKKTAPLTTTKPLTLTGDNKLDVLQIDSADLVCISSANNYVEINYLQADTLRRKLLRNTLKNIHQEAAHLIQVHRSYLINPVHFKEWKDGNTILVTQMEVPVSKKYKPALLAIHQSSLKTDD